VFAVCRPLAARVAADRRALGLNAAIAFPPVSTVIPIGVLVAERTLYLPSAGIAIAVGAAVTAIPGRRATVLAAALVLLGAARSATRVPVWRDDVRLTESILEDSPSSYRGPARMGGLLQSARRPERALEAYRQAVRSFDRDPGVFVAAADAAITIGQPGLADSLRPGRRLCPGATGCSLPGGGGRARRLATAAALVARVPAGRPVKRAAVFAAASVSTCRRCGTGSCRTTGPSWPATRPHIRLSRPSARRMIRTGRARPRPGCGAP
jgi:hypothetical protein